MIIAIVGCSGSGKTFLTNYLSSELKASIPVHTTTREKRQDDNGLYIYREKNDFLSMEAKNMFFISSGDGKRYYGIERLELDLAKSKSPIQIINISLKDIPQIVETDILIIMTRYERLLTDYFRNGIINKVGRIEAIKRLYIYIWDRIKYRKLIKKRVNIQYVFGSPLEKLLVQINDII